MSSETLSQSNPYFRIKVVDAETGRGVPLIRLFTFTMNTEHFTDSNGLIAFHEPGLMGRPVFFRVDGHGYRMPKNADGERGIELVPEAGKEALIQVERLHPAQRIYRITGQGIYRDTVLLGEKPPTAKPLLNSGVCGQDSAQTAVYQGRVFWIWGDTMSERYHRYWNFKVTGATSELPDNGGLDPEVGVDLDYISEGEFTKKMAPLPGDYLYWLSSLHTVRDGSQKERLLAFYGKIAAGEAIEKETPGPARREEDDAAHRPMGHGKFRQVGWGRVVYNDEKQVFESLSEYPTGEHIIEGFGSSPFRHSENGKEYLCFARGIPCVRVPYDFESLGDPHQAEVFTCLKPGCRKAQAADDIDRDEQGRIRWAWKKATNAVDPDETDRLIAAGLLREGERLCRFTDIATGQKVWSRGSIYYNDYRKRWIAILQELGGSSAFGEIWYVEADTMLGPWIYARKIVTHDNYSFYNVIQHPYFAKDGGRKIFFEATYTYTFTHPLNIHPTPRYDYNQIMYMLELDDPRLYLPVPIYRYEEEGGRSRYRDHASIPPTVEKRRRVFFAPDRPRAGTVAIHEALDRKSGATVLTRTDYDALSGEHLPTAFYGIPLESAKRPPMTAPLYEYTHVETQERLYSIVPPADIGRYYMSPEPVCLVWSSPIEFDPYAL